MPEKHIKNEQWTVKQLMSKIGKKEIIKPKFQRKKKWELLPNKNICVPNNKDYIRFLFDTENSVHAITFGQESTSNGMIYSNIDGNNRINAIKNFCDKPFQIFEEYLDGINKFIETIELSDDDKITLKDIFKSLSYSEFMHFKYNTYFIDNIGEDFYKEKIKIYRDEFEPIIEKIQKKLLVNGTEHFDLIVKINVNLFEGYNTEDLCNTFENINKYNSKLTETELLACRLYKDCNFTIDDKSFESKLKDFIIKYYEEKSEQEVLECFKYDCDLEINSHDFIIGFQNLCHKDYERFIEKPRVDGLSLFFKIYKSVNGGLNFNTKNINDFINYINYSCDIINTTVDMIFTDKINDKLFNNTCKDKINTLQKNNLFLLISSIIGYQKKSIEKEIIIKNIEKTLIYHFFVNDIKNTEKKDYFRNYDLIYCKAGGIYIENLSNSLLETPEKIVNKLSDKLLNELFDYLYKETNTPNEKKNISGKRRKIKFFEKTIMFYYYKEKIPTNLLNCEFSLEHIIPNSSEWEGELDKDRTGNLIPILSRINSQRQNKHIDQYKKTEEGKQFFMFIKDIIPETDIYNNIISHDKKPPFIKDNKKFSEMCNQNEIIYRENFLRCLV